MCSSSKKKKKNQDPVQDFVIFPLCKLKGLLCIYTELECERKIQETATELTKRRE